LVWTAIRSRVLLIMSILPNMMLRHLRRVPPMCAAGRPFPALEHHAYGRCSVTTIRAGANDGTQR